jgi:tRNA(fMet)-specific endonuclease VapC
MFLLDTDHLSIVDQDAPEGVNLRRRLAAVAPGEVAVTIIPYEEQTRGWLAYMARAKTTEQQVEAYRRLRLHVERFRRITLVDFDVSAAAEFERLRQARIRIGTMDLKIAAIALANNATLLSRNLADFGKVPGLRVEDWTL